MNFRFTIGLLIVLVLVASGVYWSDARSEPIPTPTPTAAKILSFDASNVSDLAVAWGDKQVALHKDNSGQWQLTQPEAAPAASDQVDSAVSELSTTSANRDLVVKPEELSSYGLDKPQGTITVTLTSGESQRLFVGNANPNNTAYYTRRPTTNGDVTIHIAPASVVEALKQFAEQPPKAQPTPTAAPSAPTPEAAPQPSPTP